MKKDKAREKQTEKLIGVVVEAIKEKKGYDIKVIDLRGITNVADFFIVCSGDSGAQLRAIKDSVKIKTREIEEKPNHVEEDTEPQWVLIDFFDVIVHIFKPETREYYSLERLWADAKIKEY